MRYRYFLVFTSLCFLVPGALYAKPNLCPEARYLPQFTINVNTKSDLALYDSWQIFYDGTPISDIQLTDFAKHDSAKEKAKPKPKGKGKAEPKAAAEVEERQVGPTPTVQNFVDLINDYSEVWEERDEAVNFEQKHDPELTRKMVFPMV